MFGSVGSTPVKFTEKSYVDAFGRHRISELHTITDIKHLYDKQPLFYDESITNTSGNATSTHSITHAKVAMHVGANDTIIRQSKMRFNYQPGKSQIAFMTTNFQDGVASVKKRVGLFTSTNGLFFELDGTTMYIVERKASSDTRVEQADWNENPLDGTGPRKITLDLTKTQLLVIDFAWLGVGTVRYGFVIDGEITYVHSSHHSNRLADVYMSTPNLPFRYEISSTGGVGDLDHICSTIMSEGGTTLNGIVRSIATTSAVTLATSGTIYPIISIRLKSTHLDAGIILNDIFAVGTTNDNFRWILSWNPTLSSEFTYTSITNSPIEYGIGTGTRTISSEANLGTIIKQGFASSQSREATDHVNNALRIGSTIAGVSDRLVLSIVPLSTNLTVYASMNWRELT